MLSAGIAIYLLLFLVFLNAHRRQRLSDERLSRTQEVIIASLAYQAEIRDMETGRHLERTSAYVRLLAEALRRKTAFSGYLTDEYLDDLNPRLCTISARSASRMPSCANRGS